jgi:hypothetical protein
VAERNRPQYGDGNFIGAQTLTQFRLFDMYPTGMLTRDARLEGIMGTDGVQNCSSAQNLGASLSDVHYDDEGDLRGKPRHRDSSFVRLAQKVDVCLPSGASCFMLPFSLVASFDEHEAA